MERNHLAHYSSVGAAAAGGGGGDGTERNGRRGSVVAPGTERIMMVPWNSTADSARRQLDGSGVPVGLNKPPRDASGAWCAAAVAPPPAWRVRAPAALLVVALVPPRYPAPVFPPPLRSDPLACTQHAAEPCAPTRNGTAKGSGPRRRPTPRRPSALRLPCRDSGGPRPFVLGPVSLIRGNAATPGSLALPYVPLPA